MPNRSNFTFYSARAERPASANGTQHYFGEREKPKAVNIAVRVKSSRGIS
ncbi:MAG: hypothetical protein RM022_008965 [Nostoc sp. EfeVER01]|nr:MULTISPECIES: hypothetical protein [unclassified Nostoc]MDZ7945540.1 hypothetical protein [Nostoc sp. EfeVER01]MDZ7994476.1 hypothetical protein [Nostoc sp. EspVER01]